MQESDVLPESSEYIQGNNVAANFVEDEMEMEIGEKISNGIQP